MASRDARRWWSRIWRRERGPEELDSSRSDLVVVASGFDDAEACSAVLERAAAGAPAWDPTGQVVLRHHLLLPAEHVADAVAVAAQDGYRADGAGPPAERATAETAVRDAQLLVLARVQVLDALHCSQERSRMAGLAQLREGLVLGWDALQPDPTTGTTAG